MCEETIAIPKRIVFALHIDGYFREFYENTQKGMSHKEAWEKLENEFELYELPARYDNFESFKRGKSYHFKKKQQKISFW